MDKRPVGVFDSGLGGLTAVRKLMEVLPGEDIVYLGDTGRVPYGGRSRETIIKYTRQDIDFLMRHDVKAIVAACGTVSTNGLDEIAGAYDVPVWGVADAAAIAAAERSKSGRVGIIGTCASVKSTVYDEKIRKSLPGALIFKEACPLFVPLVEAGRTDKDDTVLNIIAWEYLAPIKEMEPDVLIMGCTHYPLIRETIAEIMGPQVSLIDPGAETAKRLRDYLRKEDLLSGREQGSYRYFVTDSAEDFSHAAELFLEAPVGERAHHISLEQL